MLTTEIVILEMPVNHVSLIIGLLEFGMENPSVKGKNEEKILYEIRDHILRQCKAIEGLKHHEK